MKMEQIGIVLFLIFFALKFLVEFVLNELNMRHVSRRGSGEGLPALFAGKMTPEDYRKSVETTLAKEQPERKMAKREKLGEEI